MSRKPNPNAKIHNPHIPSMLTEVYNNPNSRWNLYRCECGVEKLIRKRTVRQGHAKSCGCLARKIRQGGFRRSRLDCMITFFSNLSESTAAGCREWIGGRGPTGYGWTTWDGKRILSHRLSALLDGQDINGKQVLHSCDNPPCCNPEHLRCGDAWENMNDMYTRKRDRHARGEAVTISKLNEAAVREIRSTRGKLAYLANKFGVSESTIVHVKARETWRHVA